MSDSVQKMNTINFSDLQNWSVISHIVNVTYASKYPFVRIGSFLKRTKESIEIQDDVNYKRATIKINNGGIFLRDIVAGKNIGTKNQYVIHEGQLLLSKIDARNGAFGIVPKVVEGGVITGNFWVFEIDTKQILPQILCSILSSQKFQSVWEACSNGTTNRHYLQESAFLNTKIPVPPLSVQAEIINNYQNQVLQAQFIQSEHDYSSIEKILENKLQLQFNQGSQHAEVLAFINYSQCFTWDAKDRKNSVFTSLKYHQLPLSAIAQINPSLSQSIKDETEVSFVPMECVSDLDGYIKQTRICKSSAKGFTKFENGDIIWAKITPCMQNGKSAVVYNLKNGIGYGSTEFYVIRVNKEFVIPEYIYYLLRTYRVREAAVSYFSGSAGQQRVRKSFLEELSIPLPSIEEQKEIVEILDAKKAEIISARLQAESLLTKAKQDFENAIFG